MIGTLVVYSFGILSLFPLLYLFPPCVLFERITEPEAPKSTEEAVHETGECSAYNSTTSNRGKNGRIEEPYDDDKNYVRYG